MSAPPKNFETTIFYDNFASAILKLGMVLLRRTDSSDSELDENNIPKLVVCAQADNAMPILTQKSKYGLGLLTVQPTDDMDFVLPLFQNENEDLKVPTAVYLLEPQIEGDLQPMPLKVLDRLNCSVAEPIAVGTNMLPEEDSSFNEKIRFFHFYPRIGNAEPSQILEKLGELSPTLFEKSRLAKNHEKIEKIDENIADLVEKINIKLKNFANYYEWSPKFDSVDAKVFLRLIKKISESKDSTLFLDKEERQKEDAEKSTTIISTELYKMMSEYVEKTEMKEELTKKQKAECQELFKKTNNLVVQSLAKDDVENSRKAVDCLEDLKTYYAQVKGFSNDFEGKVELHVVHVIKFVQNNEQGGLFEEVDGSGSTKI